MGTEQGNRRGGRRDGPVGYEAVFAAAPDGILIVGPKGIIRDMNPKAADLLGYSYDELVGSAVERVVPAASRDLHRTQRARYMAHPRARPMGMGMELRALRKDGREIPVEISLSPCSVPDGDFVIAVVRDVSERRRLRRLSAGTLQATEEERRRIARELHDDTAQRLAALLVRLKVLRRTRSEEARTELMDQMHEELADGLEGLRRISRGLRPPALEDLGVEAALRSHLRTSLESSGLDVDVSLDGVDALAGPERQLVLYRVVQEAISNVIRHAEASRIRVEIEEVEDQVVTRIVDDGRGFEPHTALTDGAGLGLVGMDERARLVGGELRVRSEPGRGTEVELRIPMHSRGQGTRIREEDASHGA